MKKYRTSLMFISMLTYFALLILTFAIFYKVNYAYLLKNQWASFLLIGLYSLTLFRVMRVYEAFSFGEHRIADLVFSSTVSLLIEDIGYFILLSIVSGEVVAFAPIIIQFAIQFLVTVISCYFLSKIYFSLTDVKMMIAFHSGNLDDLISFNKINTMELRFSIQKTVDVRDFTTSELNEEIDQSQNIILGWLEPEVYEKLYRHAFLARKRINVLPSALETSLNSASRTQLLDMPVFLSKESALKPEEKIAKRGIDIIGSFIFLVVTLPVSLAIALAIKLENNGPVLFKQQRLTQDHRIFEIYKFRSMQVDTTSDEVTRVGAFIRKHRIDELPQMLNVLKGDMALVGPRPLIVSEHENSVAEMPEFELRLKVKSGITGQAQVYGRHSTTNRDKLNMDLIYIENYSLLNDFNLMFNTIKKFFTKEDIYSN